MLDVRKIISSLLVLWGVITAVFFLFNVLPADPSRMLLGQQEDDEQLKVIRKKYGLDQPIFVQYLYYLNDLSPVSIHSKNENHYTFCEKNKYHILHSFNFKNYKCIVKTPYLGVSLQKNGKKVSSILAETLPNTILLAISSIGIAFFLGIFLGIVAALYKDKWIDKLITIFSTLGMSVPSFLSAILCSWILGFLLRSYTHLNMTGSLYEVDDFGHRSLYTVEKFDITFFGFRSSSFGCSYSTDAKCTTRSFIRTLHQNCQG